MNLIILIIFTTVFATSNLSSTDVAKFVKSCPFPEKYTTTIESSDLMRIECLGQNQNRVEKSAWFKGPERKLEGRLERTRNQRGVIHLDQEYDSRKKLKQETFYIETSAKPNEPIQNMFVFDKNGYLIRGNISLDGKNFVVVYPNLIFLNGQPSNLKVLSNELQKNFLPSKSKVKNFHNLVEKIWNKQNSPLSYTTPQESRGGVQ